MCKFWFLVLILCLGPVAALAEASVRPLARPDRVAAAGAPDLRPLRRAVALPPLPEPAPLVLPDTLVAAAKLAPPRDRLAEGADWPTRTVLSTSNAPPLAAPALPTPAFVAADAPTLGPRSRPAALPAAAPAKVTAPQVATRPRARPPEGPEQALVQTVAAAAALPAALRPAKRPKGLTARRLPATKPAPEAVVEVAATRVRPGEALVRTKKGSVCGDPAIRGEALAPIPARMKGCGIAEPVRVTEVDGVRLSTPATLDCDAARALRKWVERGLKPAASGAKVKGLVVAASYACRPRNNVRGARVSEHGRGNAIDIAGVVLADGRTLDVLGDYKSKRGAILRRAHKAACGIFGTTLGPGSDGYHENHLHFDVAAHRSGPYCR